MIKLHARAALPFLEAVLAASKPFIQSTSDSEQTDITRNKCQLTLTADKLQISSTYITAFGKWNVYCKKDLKARPEYPRVGAAGKHSIRQCHSSFTRLGSVGGGVLYFIPEFLLPDSTGFVSVRECARACACECARARAYVCVCVCRCY